MCELEEIGKIFTSKLVGTGPSSYKKRIYRAAVSQRLRNTMVEVSATDWSFAQRSPTECGASLCVIKKPRKNEGCNAKKTNNIIHYSGSVCKLSVKTVAEVGIIKFYPYNFQWVF